MVLVETFQIFYPRMVGASGLGLSYWIKIIFLIVFQPLNVFPDCVWLKVSLAMLLIKRYSPKNSKSDASRMQNMDVQVQHRL